MHIDHSNGGANVRFYWIVITRPTPATEQDDTCYKIRPKHKDLTFDDSKLSVCEPATHDIIAA